MHQPQIQRDGRSITLIHFAYDTGHGLSGGYRIACMPNMLPSEFGETAYHPVVHHTNEYRAVTCPACKKSSAYMGAESIHSAGKK